MHQTKPEFSIIIPAFNEEQILESSITGLQHKLRKAGLMNYEILLVENGSTDNSLKTGKFLSKKFHNLHVSHINSADFGKAVNLGFQKSKSKKIILFNADWWDISFLKKSLNLLDKHPIIIGSKAINPYSDKRSPIRKFGSRLLTQSLKWLFNYSGTDSHGLKAFRRKELMQILPGCITSEIIESEILIKFKNLNLPIKELPVAIKEIRPARVSFVNRCFRVLKELIYLKISLKPAFSIRQHADDAGYNSESVKGVKALIAQNKLSSFSVLINSSCFSEAVSLIKKHSQIPVFLHFNLIEGLPVSDAQNIQSLVNNQGQFIGKYKLIRRLITGQIVPEQIKTELISQLRKMHEHHILIQGIDSHQHLHALSPIAEIFKQVAKENKIKYIRSYSQMKTQTFSGRIKLEMFKIISRISHFIYYRSLTLPVTWQIKFWLDFYVGSWENINFRKVKDHQIAVIHPGLNYDK